MGKNVAVFVDVANIFYAAKAAGVDIDYVTLLKAAVAGRDFVRAYAYTGLDPENENQRNFHSFLSRNGYKVVSKDIRKYGDGKVKANLDIELVVDMMKTARNLDVAIVVSGDGDFAPAIRAVQEMGVRVEVISFRGNTSSDLIEVADIFTDIVHLAKVDKSSTRSGRRVTADEEDLSMTEVPDKQTEGTGRGRGGRGRGGRGRGERLEPVATGGRQRNGASSGVPSVAASATGGGAITVLPGEKLSKVAAPPARAADDEEEPLDESVAVAGGEGVEVEGVEGAEPGSAEGEIGEDGEGRRRRRRRGGRGRGRGRGRGEEGEFAAAPPARDEEEEEAPVAPRGPRPTPFGSVWDSQIGLPTRTPAAANLTPLPIDEEDLEEPEIPEYLLAEQRRRGRGPSTGLGGGQGRGGRGARSAYAAAIDRERYGRGGGSGGINRYPDVSGRGRPERQDRPERGRPEPRRDDRPAPYQGQRPERRHDEPWSEVPPELEQMLRAQVANRPRGESAASSGGRTPERPEGATPAAGAPDAGQAQPEGAPQGRGRGRGRRPGAADRAVADAAAEGGVGVEAAAPAAAGEATTERAAASTASRRARPPRGARGGSAAEAAGTTAAPGDTVAGDVPAAAEAAPRSARGRTTTRRPSGGAQADVPAPAPAEPGPAESGGRSSGASETERAPRRRAARGAAETAGAAASPAGGAPEAAADAGRTAASRTRRRSASAPATPAPDQGGSSSSVAEEAPKRRAPRRRSPAEPTA